MIFKIIYCSKFDGGSRDYNSNFKTSHSKLLVYLANMLQYNQTVIMLGLSCYYDYAQTDPIWIEEIERKRIESELHR